MVCTQIVHGTRDQDRLSLEFGRAPELCGWALSSFCPPLVIVLAAALNSVNSVAGLCGWALCPGLVLLLAAPLNSVNSVAGLCGWALSSSCHRLGHGPELCQLCGWAVWLGSVSRPCPPLVLLLAAPLSSVNSVAGLCVQALSSSCPPLGRAPELCQLCGWAVWLGSVSSCPPLGRAPELCQLCGWALCPGLVLLNSVNSVAGLCVQALSSCCPLCQLCGWAVWLGSVAPAL